MAPSHTISSHLCKQIYASWRQNKSGQPQANANPANSNYFARAPSPEKRSMDSDRSDTSSSSSLAGSPPISRQSSSSSWTRFGGR